MSEPELRTEDDFALLDLAALITGGLVDEAIRGPNAARWLFAEGAVAAAIRAGQVGVLPRSLTFLAEIVRRGGVPYAIALPNPLPAAGQAELAWAWLAAAEHAAPAAVTSPAAAMNRDRAFARWLDAVAVLVEARQAATRP